MPRLHFKGKVFVENHHLAVPFHELLPVREKGQGGHELAGDFEHQGLRIAGIERQDSTIWQKDGVIEACEFARSSTVATDRSEDLPISSATLRSLLRESTCLVAGGTGLGSHDAAESVAGA